jgi:ribosomal protein L37AE/L43A
MSNAKAGDKVTAKAASRIRKVSDYHARIVSTPEGCTVQAKSDATQGLWVCVTCGEIFQNNFEAGGHPESHKLGWMTNGRIEEP